MPATGPIYFGSFEVTSQVFYGTVHSFALVNHKPLLPGHVLVCSNQVVPRIGDLSAEEVADLFLTVQRVGKVIEAVYEAEGLNIAIQDGSAAGQSVPHVHVHIIPRRFEDLTHSDDIYTMLESEEGDLGKIFREHGDGPREAHQPDTLSEPARVITDAMEEMVLTGVMQAPVSSAEQPGLQQQQQVALPAVGMGTRPKFPVPLPDELRKPRTTEEMREEAQLLERYMDDYHAFRMIL